MFLEWISIENPFSTTHFCWIDFGLTHIAKYHIHRSLKDIVSTMWSREEYVNKIHLSIFTAIDWRSIDKDPHEYWFNFNGEVAGGIFGGNNKSIRDLWSKFWTIAYQKLDDGYAPLEQSILAYIVSKNVEKFQPWFGRYDEVGINWGGIYIFSQHLLNMVDQAHYFGYLNKDIIDPNLLFGDELTRQLLEGHELKRYDLGPELTAKILTIMFVCRWYRTAEFDRVKQTQLVGEEIIRRYEEDANFRQAIQSSKQFFVDNLSLVNLSLPQIPENSLVNFESLDKDLLIT